jgi:uncharacterized protein YjgD (DUF1641 family)
VALPVPPTVPQMRDPEVDRVIRVLLTYLNQLKAELERQL